MTDVSTQASLLDRLRTGADVLAWDEFYNRYGRAVYAYARKCRCTDDVAEEIVQEVMLTVFMNRLTFRYDPERGRFRDWLHTVVRQKINLHFRRHAHDAKALPDEAAIPVSSGQTPDKEWEALFDRAVLASMLDVIRRQVNPETYQAFELGSLRGLPPSEVAGLLGMTRNAVYLARKRVLQRLQELGAPYREDGHLDEQVKQVLELSLSPRVEQALTTRMEAAFRSIRESAT